MHYTLKIFTVILIVLICGCSALKPTADFDEKKYETDKAEINIQIPEFKNFSDNEFEKKLNIEYSENINELINNFSEQCTDEEKCKLTLKQTCKYNKSPFLSIIGEGEMFTGGVHGNSFRIAKNIDVEKNTELNLSDLFVEDWSDKINKKMCEIEKKNPEKYHDLWERPKISDEKNFYLTDEGVVIFFPPYELSYYARGFVEFLIPYTDIVGNLKEEYRYLAK